MQIFPFRFGNKITFLPDLFAYMQFLLYLCAQIVFIWLKQQNRIWIKRVERYRTRG